MTHSPIQLIPREMQRLLPWKNGGGRTREVATDEDRSGTFRWRVSVAEVDRDGPFSEFPGVDRTLWLLRGAGMALKVDGVDVRLLEPYEPFGFAGEARVSATLIDGPTEDLNLMVRRDRSRANAAILRGSQEIVRPGAARPRDLLVLALDGTCDVTFGDSPTHRLLSHDAAVLRSDPAGLRLRPVHGQAVTFLAEFFDIGSGG
ncbi:MAG: HutD family protein [Planctomycetota bacterium]